MQQTPFHAYRAARILSGYGRGFHETGADRLIPAFASSNIEIYPYQIAAASFALRSRYLPGCILCDECSLGKTYEALLIAAQKWHEGRERLLLVTPPNLIKQWITKIETAFALPHVTIDGANAFDKSENPFEQAALVVTTYDFAVEKYEYIKQIKWDMAIFDEADCLNKAHTGENKTANRLKEALDGCFKLLLTPTPITKDIMDIYGLLYFIENERSQCERLLSPRSESEGGSIPPEREKSSETIFPVNETILPGEKEFYDRYFRKPENYPELTEWVSRYCFRSLKTQVSGYVNFTNRIPYTVGYDLTEKEKRLYNLLDAYLALPHKFAFPKMERYNLTLDYYHTLSSSAQAFVETLNTAINRMEHMEENEERFFDELNMLKELRKLAKSIDVNGKSKTGLAVLRKCFARLKKQKLRQKAIVFTDNLTTLEYLRLLFDSKGYGVLTYSGANSRDHGIMERFRNDDGIQLLIAMDDATKGIDIEFCPVVLNYDIHPNALKLEQRISRCHRQGQRSDVLAINLIGKENYADVRYMELINKRVLQFDGIFGMSDNILGNFDANPDSVLDNIRKEKDIQATFDGNLEAHEAENKDIVAESENILFTTFTREVAEKVTVTPQYIEGKIRGINDDLWEVVKWYFNRFNADAPLYEIDEEERTITLTDKSHVLCSKRCFK